MAQTASGLPPSVERHLATFDGKPGIRVYGEYRPEGASIWYFDTRYSVAQFIALMDVGRNEGGRYYLIPPQEFTQWLRDQPEGAAIAPLHGFLARHGVVDAYFNASGGVVTIRGIQLPLTPAEVALADLVYADFGDKVRATLVLPAWQQLCKTQYKK